MEYVLDVHTHTIASGHAYSTMREMATMARDKGLEVLGITEHAVAMPDTCGNFYFQNLKMVDRHMVDGIELMLGVELNILDFDGSVDMKEEVLKKMDIVVASMHIPCMKKGTREENTRSYINIMKNPYVDIIGHPDDGRFPVDYKELVYGAKEYGKLLEVNNNSLDPRCTRQGGYENYREILEYCKELGVSIVVNSDAHVDHLVGNHKEAYDLLEKISFPEELVVNRSVTELKKRLRKYK